MLNDEVQGKNYNLLYFNILKSRRSACGFFLKSRLFLVRDERGPEEGGEGGGQQGGGPRTTGADSWNTRTTPKAEIRQVQCANIFLDVFYLGMSYKESFRCNNYFTTA